VLREGKRIRTRHIEVRFLASPLGFPRVGIVVPRHRHTAVDRNRLKRRIRELVRQQALPVLPSIDLVLRASPAAYGAQFEDLAAEVHRVATQLSASRLEE
jgi:ribonuclease P protein component